LRAKICCFHLKTSNYPPCWYVKPAIIYHQVYQKWPLPSMQLRQTHYVCTCKNVFKAPHLSVWSQRESSGVLAAIVLMLCDVFQRWLLHTGWWGGSLWHVAKNSWHQDQFELDCSLTWHTVPTLKRGRRAGSTALTFLQGLGHRTAPLEGRFMTLSFLRSPAFTGTHIRPLSLTGSLWK
jgi:hypothetical protein